MKLLRAFVLAVTAFAGPACKGGSEPVARHFVLVTIDTHRGDHVLEERGGVALTPFLSSLAERSLVFREAMSVSDATTPGTAGILTGLWPTRSGVIANSHVVDASLPTLADLLQREGFRTAAFVSNPNLRRGTGFERGFETYERLKGEKTTEGARAKARAEAVSKEALAWLAEQDVASERLFLWVHYMEPHGPYEPPTAVRELFSREAFEAPRDLELLKGRDNSGRGGIPPYQHVVIEEATKRDGREYLARYAAEVRAIDEGLASLWRELESSGILDDSVVVITADHGEALAGERGSYFSHANGASRDQVHVPLLVHYPACEPAVVSTPVSTVDIAPSVLSLLGLAVPEVLDGKSLLEGGSPFAVSVTQSEMAVRSGTYRLIARPDGTPRVLLEDQADPMSLADISEAHPAELKRLAELLAEVRSRRPLVVPVDR